MKFAILLTIFMAVCELAGFVDSQVVICHLEENVSYFIRLINLDTPYYTCNLYTNNLNYGDKPTRMKGIHKSDKNNDDVKYLRNFDTDQRLQTFSSYFCDKFRNLEAINVDMHLEFVEEDSFQNCKNLKHLQLHFNNFRQLPANLLAANEKLQTIYIANNRQLSSLPETFFANQNQLEFLALYKNGFNSLLAGLLSRLSKIKHKLDLSYNELTEVPPYCFQFVRNLEKLWLSGNKITTLHPDSFDWLENLEELDMNENAISNLPQNVFTPLKNLKELYLSSNKLTTIHADSFGLLPNLRKISLKYNFMSSIDERVFDSTDISFIRLQNNVCFDGEIRVRDDIKPQLETCFANYQPRVQTTTQGPLLPQIFGFTKTTQGPVQTDQQQPVGSCGRTANSKGNIIGGSFINKGAFPWLAVLTFLNGEYFCGGTLISKRKVVTAAHCMQDKSQIVTRLARDFVVSLGTHDLNIPIDPDRANYAVQTVNIHPDWNPRIQQWDADIAVLYLANDVAFSPFIQPICLIPAGSPVALITSGTVVGYGRSEDTTKEHENIPKVLDMPIIDLLVCVLKYPIWSMLASTRTFCAGRNDTQGVCGGDSGGGIFVMVDNTYYLRGIISSSLIAGTYRCDVDSYALYTDVQKYSDWIESVGGNPHFFGRK